MTNSSICTGKEETIFQYLDDELSPAERTAFKQHLAQCETCRHLLAETEMFFADFSALENVPTPTAEISAGVMAQLPSRTTHSLERWLPVAQLTIGLALLALSLPKVWNGLAWTFSLPEWTFPAAWWLSLVQRFNLPAGWLIRWSEQVFAHTTAFSVLNISPTMAFTVIAILGTAWLVSNSLLLNPKQSHTFKNGGSL